MTANTEAVLANTRSTTVHQLHIPQTFRVYAQPAPPQQINEEKTSEKNAQAHALLLHVHRAPGSPVPGGAPLARRTRADSPRHQRPATRTDQALIIGRLERVQRGETIACLADGPCILTAARPHAIPDHARQTAGDRWGRPQIDDATAPHFTRHAHCLHGRSEDGRVQDRTCSSESSLAFQSLHLRGLRK